MSVKVKKVLMEAILMVVIAGGLIWVGSRFIHLGDVVFTDNAQIRQDIVPINARVQGFIRKINFEEYQVVHKGDVLAVIEDGEFRLRLAQAEADYQRALLGKSVLKATVSTSQSNISAADANIEEINVLLQNAKSDYDRYRRLYDEEVVSEKQYEEVKTAYEALKAKYKLSVRQKKSASFVNAEQAQRLSQQDADIAAAEAAVKLARLNLSYTVITAPCDGVVGRKNIKEGQLVQIGQSLLSVVDSGEKWVIANYKETQMAHVACGMPVDISVDAIDKTIQGVVCATSFATGAQYSIVPQDNSTGNFVKVEQLVPVKICLAQNNSEEVMAKLRAGMNVECEVRY